jgi:hypothetical protein
VAPSVPEGTSVLSSTIFPAFRRWAIFREQIANQTIAGWDMMTVIESTIPQVSAGNDIFENSPPSRRWITIFQKRIKQSQWDSMTAILNKALRISPLATKLPKIAQRFNAGLRSTKSSESRQGRQNAVQRDNLHVVS